MMCLGVLGKEEQAKLKGSRWKEITKIFREKLIK